MVRKVPGCQRGKHLFFVKNPDGRCVPDCMKKGPTKRRSCSAAEVWREFGGVQTPYQIAFSARGGPSPSPSPPRAVRAAGQYRKQRRCGAGEVLGFRRTGKHGRGRDCTSYCYKAGHKPKYPCSQTKVQNFWNRHSDAQGLAISPLYGPGQAAQAPYIVEDLLAHRQVAQEAARVARERMARQPRPPPLLGGAGGGGPWVPPPPPPRPPDVAQPAFLHVYEEREEV